ncbi:heparinase II/III family protein [Spirosoma soli]|uniref:Heparinase II/III family protein n=1 Tax=Spirosoma soli TaxID=1770529 RepID=A0ABW5M0D3_9BACT
MKNYFLLCLGLSVTLSQAQVTPRNLLATRFPLTTLRSLVTRLDQWKPYPNTPEGWQKALPDTVRTSLIKAGEQAVARPFESLPATLTLEYVRTGNRSHYEQVSFGKRNQLLTLVLAEAIEGKGRFTDAILNGVWSICEESFWGVPAHLNTQRAKSGLPDVDDRTVDLFAAETAALLALADYFVGDQLAKVSPLVRPRMYAETNQRIFLPLMEHADRYGYLKPGAKVNNWNPWIMSNWLTAALLLETDEMRRTEMVHSAMNGLDLYINDLGNDGGCDEGPSYWFVAGACVFDALELLHSATNGKVNVFNDPIIRNMASYVYKMHIAGGYFVDFADADPTLKPDGLMLYRFGNSIRNDTLARFGTWAYHTFKQTDSPLGFNRHRRVQNLLTIREAGSQTPTFQDVRDAWFTDVQVMTARSDKGLYVASHGGHNAESHNHNDVGDFILYANGQPVIIDVGRGAYTAKTFSAKRYDIWYNTSLYHNLPIINGVGQSEGRAFEARDVRYNATSNASSLAMDLAKAYPAAAGVDRWNRLVKLDRSRNAVLIQDNYVLSQPPTSIQQAFMTVCQVNTSQPGKVTFQTADGHTVVLAYDAKVWQAKAETIPLNSPEDATLASKWANRPIQRVLLSHIPRNTKGQTAFTFTLL